MTKLKIAIQKSGRLFEDSLKILKECGISIENGTEKLKSVAENFPIEIFFLRNSDIPQYVEDGVADVGIIGENLLYESDNNLEVMLKLGFSKCRLSMAIPKKEEYCGIQLFNNKKIATSYPKSLKKFLTDNNLNSEIHTISGSVEIAPNIGLADAVCDLVSSGNTLFSNGLKEVHTILQSQAVLVKRNNLIPDVQEILDKLIFRIKSVLNARNNKYVLLNCPVSKIQEIAEILPGMKSPTILPLMDKNWCSIHSVINEYKFWEVIDKLKEAGAEGILIIPIEKMVF